MVQPEDSSIVLFDCYEGTYGQTLRIDIQSAQGLNAFIQVLLGFFLEEERGGISLRESLERTMFVPPLADVRLKKHDREQVRFERDGEGELVIEWCEPPEGWEDALELCRSLTEVQAEHGRHQYLTRSERCATVELAVME